MHNHNYNYKSSDVSIVIPSFNFKNSFIKVFQNILNQTIKPLEIIIIDSSPSNIIKDYIDEYIDDSKIIYRKITRAYPGKARNIGASLSKGSIIGFVDSKTVPESNWLEKSLEKMNKDNLDVVFGKTQYVSLNKYQELIKLSIYGNIGHETVPGSLIKKEIFKNSNEFNNKVRTAEDISWRYNLKIQERKYFLPNKPNVFYYDIPSSFFVLLLRYFIYSFNTIKINAQNNSKDLYLSILILLSTLIIPKWNVIVENYEIQFLKINEYTQIFVLSIMLIYLINVVLKYIFYNFLKESFFNIFIKMITLISSIFFVFSFNNYIYNLISSGIILIPHTTKIYLASIFIFGLIYRGIVLPLNRKVSLKSIFPIQWILIGFIGVSFDVMKAPAYIMGGIYSLQYFFIRTPIPKYIKNKKILIICPYPKGEQAGQRLKYEQQFANFESFGFEVVVRPFMDKEMWTIIYKRGFFFRKIWGTLKGYLKRLFLIFQLYKYDVVYIFLWATPFEDYIFERMFFFFSRKIIYDIEDNVLLMEKNEINPITYYLKSKNKITYLIKNSSQIITSSKKLIDICNDISNKNNSYYIPPGMDIKRYLPSINYQKKEKITIGWTGTFTSKKYLTEIIPILQKLNKIRKIKLLLITNFDFSIDDIELQVIRWTKEKEIEDLLKIDIGIYPLIDEKWVEGKSGLKALQYMALGIPTVASNIGNTLEVINHMENGILVNNDEEWLSAFLMLIDNLELRKKIGINSKKTIIQQYSVEKIGQEYKKVLLLN